MHAIRTITVALGSAAVLAHSALAGGEPKNQWPFTRPVGDRAPQSTQVESSAVGTRGEAKNQLPFTRPVSQPTTIVVQSGGGFSWTDGAIGLAAGIGVAISGAGAVALGRSRSPRTA